MTKVKTKRKRPQKWVLVWWRAVGEFKDGERKMIEVDRYRRLTYRSEQMARKAKARYGRKDPSVIKGFIQNRRKPDRIIEIQVNYPAE